MLRSFFFHDHAKHGEDDARAGEPALASSQTGSTITALADNTSAKAPVSTPNSTPTPPAEADAAVPADDAEALAFARASSAVSDQLFNTARANAASDSSKTPDVKADAAPNQQPAGPELQADSEQLLSQIAQQSAHTKITALKQLSSAQKKPDNEVHTIIIHTEPVRIYRRPPEHSQQDEQGLTGHAAPAAYAAQNQTYSANTNTVIMRSPVPPVIETSAHPANVPVQTQSSARKQHQSSRWWDTFSSNTNVWRAGDNAQNSAAGLGSDADAGTDAGTGSSAEHEAAAGTSTGSPAPEGLGSDSDSAAVTAAAAAAGSVSASASASDSESIFEVVSAKPLRPFSASVTSTQAVSTSAEPVITSVEPENSDRPEDTKDEASAQSGSTPAQSADLEALNDHGELFTRPESLSGSESIFENSENAEYHENDESSDAAESSARADGSESSDEVDDSAEAALPAEPSDLSSEQPSKDTTEPASELPSGQHSVDAAAAGEIKTDAEPAVKNQTEADAEVATVTDDLALDPAQSREQGPDPEPEQKPEQSEDAQAQQSKPVQQVYLQRGEESLSRPVSLMAVPYGNAFSYVSAMPDLSAAVYSNVQMKFHFVSAFKSAVSAAAKLISHPAGTEDPAQAAAPPAQESASTIEEQPLPLAADAAASAAQGSDNASAPTAAAAPSPALKLKLSVGRFKDAFEMSQLEYKSAAFEPRTNPLPGPSKLTAIWEERLKHRTHMVILARDETTGELIGFAAIEKPFICGYIRAVYIAPQYFRCGVGRALVEACANHLRLFGARKVALEVEKHNLGAKAFYEALNFRPSAVQSTPHLMRLEKEL